MEVQAHLESERIELLFADEGELREFVEAARSQGAFLLELAELPAPFASYQILLRLGPGIETPVEASVEVAVEVAFEATLEASVVQLFPEADPPSAAFQLAPLERSWDLEFERRLKRAAKPAEDHSEMTGVPPIVRIRRMNVRERMFLAAKADRAERAALLRDSSAQVLMGLITNPRIGADDIVQIIRNPQVSPGVLDRITRETRWLANPEIQKALVRNPKTPSPVAMRLVDGLPTEELRKLAKIQSGLRENLRKAALRAYLKRSRR